MIVFQQSPTVTEGNRTVVDVLDHTQESILGEILAELMKMNIHLTFITDNELENTEVQ